jgi:thioredoxin reductase (NADPH)
MENKDFDLIIVGGGPTGILCGWECQQAGLSYLILEKGALVHSLYNFPDEMTFFSTSTKLEIADTPFLSHHPRPTRDEALEYYRRIVLDNELHLHTYEDVEKVDRNDGYFSVITNKDKYTSRGVIIATGYYSQPNLMNIPGESLPKVSHYYKNPHDYIGKDLLVIGAANSACDAALECWQKGAHVTMAVRGAEINPRVKYWIRPNIVNRIKEGSITAHFQTEVKEIRENEVILEKQGEQWSVPNDFVLALTGYHPDYAFLRESGVAIENDEDDTPVCDEDHLETNIPNLYLAGVIQCGMKTHRLFIENTRDHGRKIVDHFLKKHSIA